MNEKISMYSRKIGLQVLGLCFLLILLIEFTNVEILHYVNLGNISLFASLILAYSSYLTLNEKKTINTIKILFLTSIGIITISNLFLFEYISKYHEVLYSILIGQIVLFPSIIKNNLHELKKEKLYSNKYLKKTLIAIFLITITLLSFYLRIYHADIISPGRDSLHHYIAAKSINDNGSTVYETQPYINHMLALIFRTIGETLILARLPFIIAGTFSVLLTYLIGRKISNSIGIISALLFSICPWAIGLSRYVRDYSLNLFYELTFIALLLYFPKNLNKRKNFLIFILLNIIIYSTLITFAKFQKGLTISMIIALLITSFIRIFAELEIYSKIKSLNIYSKETNLIANAAIISIIVGIFIIVAFGFDKRLILTFQPKWLFFFLSESRLPTLWYSLMQIPWYFIVSLTLIPLIAKPKNKYIWISFLIFYAYLSFFVFFARPQTAGLNARYIYPALPFFIILISTTIFYILITPLKFSKKKNLKIAYTILTIIFLLTVFNPKNTYFAADGTKSTEDNNLQVISVPYRDYSQLISFLQNESFSKNDTVLSSELRMKDTLAWYFDFDFYESKNITSFNTLQYDIADNIYVLNEENVQIIKDNNNGWIIRRDGDAFPKSISLRDEERVEPVEELKELNISIEYLGIYSKKYEVYRWNTND